MSVHPVEAANRAAKALKLADVLEHHLDGDDPELLADLDEHGWLRAATLANVTPPSDATKAVVITVLRGRQSHPDPFDGFEPPEPRDRDGEAGEFARQAWEEDVDRVIDEADGSDPDGDAMAIERAVYGPGLGGAPGADEPNAGFPRRQCINCGDTGEVDDPDCELVAMRSDGCRIPCPACQSAEESGPCPHMEGV